MDVNPGDRAGKCHGMMKPVQYEKQSDLDYVVHQCIVCSFKKRNVLNPNDNFDVLLKLEQV